MFAVLCDIRKVKVFLFQKLSHPYLREHCTYLTVWKYVIVGFGYDV